MTNSKIATNARRWIYWILTIAFASTMLLAGIFYFIETPSIVQNNLHLGYPIYIYKILGVAKFLGSIAILWGRFPVLKEWAYVGYSLNLMIAAASHAFCGDSFGTIMIPITILIVVLLSYRLWKINLKNNTI
jgi:hypothetical protein